MSDCSTHAFDLPESRRMLDERGVEHRDMTDRSLVVDKLTPEQAIAATLGSNENCISERLRGIASDMRNIGASSMTPHELFAYWAREVDKAADLAAMMDGVGSEVCRRKLTAERVRKCAQGVYYEGYNDGNLHRGHGVEEID